MNSALKLELGELLPQGSQNMPCTFPPVWNYFWSRYAWSFEPFGTDLESHLKVKNSLVFPLTRSVKCCECVTL